MDRGRWIEVEELFDGLRAATVPERGRLLDARCGHDPALRAELASLLAAADADAAADAAIIRAIGSAAAALTARQIGPYRVLGILGEGGMGTVYLAERADAEYRRQVAIKVLRRDLTSDQAVARFRDERQVLATLDHPGIVRLLDGGHTEDGVPYLVMEHINGRPFTTHARALPVRERVALVIQIALALQYAHQRLVVHRDVKPSNILIDRDGRPRLLDFGIAKLLDPLAQREAETRTGTAAFTVEYCSPEQVRGEPVSVATDVYSLGAVLYDVLVGRPPQQAGATLVETLANICEREPVRPSVAAPALGRELAGDLDNILLRALAKLPARRYPSVAAFADDLRRYLTGRTVAARDATFRYRLGKLLRRRYRMLAAATTIAAALTTATVVSIRQARRADRQAASANASRIALLVDNGRQQLASGHPGRALPPLAEALRAGADTAAVRVLLGAALRPYQARIATIATEEGFSDAAWSQDGSRLALTSMLGHGGIYDREGQLLVAFEGNGGYEFGPVFSPDGGLLAAVDLADHVYVWDTVTGARVASLPVAERIANRNLFTFLDHPVRVVAAGRDDRVSMWNPATGALLGSAAVGCQPFSAAATADQATLAVGCRDGAIVLLDARTLDVGRRLGTSSTEIGWLRFSPDGARVYSGSATDIRVWDVARGTLLAQLPGRTAALSPDGTRLGVAGEDSVGRIFDAVTGVLRVELIGHDRGGVLSIAWNREGTTIATVGTDGTFRTWNATTGEPYTVIEAAAGAGRAANAPGGAVFADFTPDGTRMLTVAGTGASLWNVDRGALVGELPTGGPLWSAAWSPDETWIATAGLERGGLWPDRLPPITIPLPNDGNRRMYDVNWSPDGARIVIAGEPDLARVFGRDGSLAFALVGHTGRIARAAFSPDGRLIATGSSDRTARLWDSATGAPRAVLPHGGSVLAAAWSRDGRRLATACFDRHLRVWDVATGALVDDLDGGDGKYIDVTFSPDGRELAAGGQPGKAEIWDLATRTRRLVLVGHVSTTTNAVWSPDGALIATASSDHTVRVWDPITGAMLASFYQPGEVMSLQWSRDGERILAGSSEGTARVWDVRRARGNPLLVDAQIADHLR